MTLNDPLKSRVKNFIVQNFSDLTTRKYVTIKKFLT